MKLIVECSQKLVRLGENLWDKEQKLDKEMQEHQKLCDEIMAIQGIEQIIHCPEGYQFKDENGNVINAQKIVLEKKGKEYPKTYEECCKVLGIDTLGHSADGYKWEILSTFQNLLICRDAYWKIAGEKMGLGKPWKPNDSSGYCTYAILRHTGHIRKSRPYADSELLEFPTEAMRDAFYENFKDEIEICKELL